MISGGGVPVPDVKGQSLQAAEATLTAAGLSYLIHTEPAGPNTPGTVVLQSPGPGQTVPPGSQVTLTVAQQADPDADPDNSTPTPTTPTPTPTPTPTST